MMRTTIAVFAIAVVGLLSLALTQDPSKNKEDMVARGKYLVAVGDCNGCHTPPKYTEQGPVPDSSKFLSGYPASAPVPEVPHGVIGPGKWAALWSWEGTAFAGPWGVSFPRNLTPDTATGLGSWTPEMFIKAIRTGKDMGEGRDILPPMPWENFAKMTDNDLRAIFAYLRSLKPVYNPVPDPLSPTGEALPTGKAGKLPPK
jgi:mono/diheme cytochrome c family protein